MTDDFEQKIASFSAQLEAVSGDVFLGIVAATEESIKIGSAVTSAPGQPVQTGTLRNSYQTQVLGDREVQISSSLDYALPIEEGIGTHGPLTLRSSVGGFHSIKQTALNFQALVTDVARRFSRG